jgi:hypothetical protein
MKYKYASDPNCSLCHGTNNVRLPLCGLLLDEKGSCSCNSEEEPSRCEYGGYQYYTGCTCGTRVPDFKGYYQGIWNAMRGKTESHDEAIPF